MAPVSGFSEFLSLLAGADAFSLMFPFILAWVLYYGALEKVGFFDDISDFNANPVVSLLLAFFTARFLVMQSFYQSFFSVYFGKIAIGLASLLGLYTLLAFSGWDMGDDSDVSGYVKWIAVAMAGAAFIWAGGFGPTIFGPEEIGGGLGQAISAVYDLVFASGLFWLIIIATPLGYLMVQGDQGNGNNNNNNNNNP